MSTSILSPVLNPHKGTTSSSVFAFALDDVVQATIINPAGGLLSPCQVTLMLSGDGGNTFVPIDSKRGGMADTGTAILVFAFENYAGIAAWTHARLAFGGNTAQSQLGVTISAVGDGGSWGGGGGTPIADLPAATSLAAPDLFVVVQGGVTKNVPYGLVVVGAGIKVDAPSAGAATCDLSLSEKHNITLVNGTPTTISLSNATVGQTFRIKLIQDGTGSCTVVWFTTIKSAGGSAPTLTTTASKADVFVFECTGTNTFDGFVVGQNI